MTARKPGLIHAVVQDDTPKRNYRTRGVKLPGGEYAWAMLPDDMSRTEFDLFVAGLQANRMDWSWPDE